MTLRHFRRHVTGQQALAAIICSTRAAVCGLFPMLEFTTESHFWKSIFVPDSDNDRVGRIQFLTVKKNCWPRTWARDRLGLQHVSTAQYYFLPPPSPMYVLGGLEYFMASSLLRKARIPALPGPIGCPRRSLPGHRFPLLEVVFRR